MSPTVNLGDRLQNYAERATDSSRSMYRLTMAGEDHGDTGEDGVHRFKQWLERTTRVRGTWTRKDRPFNELLHFRWPAGKKTPFSFDLGGNFQGGDLEGHSFLAEIKKYRYESDLPEHYRSFLAKCYIVYEQYPDRCDHFLWASWAPFQARSWHKHTTDEAVKKAVLAQKEHVFGVESDEDAERLLNPRTIVAVTDRLWLITLADKQERLVIADNHYRSVRLAIEDERVVS